MVTGSLLVSLKVTLMTGTACFVIESLVINMLKRYFEQWHGFHTVHNCYSNISTNNLSIIPAFDPLDRRYITVKCQHKTYIAS